MKEGVSLSQRILAAFCVLSALFLGYWAFAMTQSEGIFETGSFINVGSNDGQGSEILAALDEAAQSKGERIAVELEQPDHTDVYAAGDFGSSWYDTIAPGSPVRVHDLSELPDEDPRQLLQLSGGEDFKNTVYGILDAYSAQHQELESLEWSFLFTDTALAGIYFLILATCFAVVVAGAIARTRDYAVWQLMGLSPSVIFAREFRRSYASAFLSALAIGAVALVLCAILVSPRVMLGIMRYSAVFLFPLLVVMVMAFLLTAWACKKLALRDRLKGKLPQRSTVAIVVLLKLVPCIAAVGLIAPALNHLHEVEVQNGVGNFWKQADDLQLLELSGARDSEGIVDSTHKLAELARAKSAVGQFQYVQFSEDSPAEFGGVGRDMLSFNYTAAMHSVEGPLREELQNNPPHEPTRYIPRGLEGIADSVPKDFYCSEHECPVEILDSDDFDVATWQIDETGWGEQIKTAGPVMTIYPDDQLPSDRTIVASMTQNGTGFLGGVPPELRDDPDLSNFVLKTNSAAHLWAKGNASLRADTVALVLGVIAAALIALTMAVIAGFLYRKLFAQRLRVYRFMGIPMARAYRYLWLADAAICCVTIAYLWFKGGQARELERMSSMPAVVAQLKVTPEAMAYGVGLSILVAVVSVMTMVHISYRAGKR